MSTFEIGEPNIWQISNKMREILAGTEQESTYQDVRIIMEYNLKMSYQEMIINANKTIDHDTLDRIVRDTNRRRSGEPTAYIVGKKNFYGHDFIVSKSTLIPRADSEYMVDFLVNHILVQEYSALSLIDLGCGTGCLSLSIMKSIIDNKTMHATLIDIGIDTLDVAKKNATALSLDKECTFVCGDIMDNNFANALNQNKFKIIVSNPPYIPRKEIQKLDRDVREFEPHIALDGGINGLDFYHHIARLSFCKNNILLDNGILAIEIGYNQKDDVAKLFSSYKNADLIKVIKDLGNRDRALIYKKV